MAVETASISSPKNPSKKNVSSVININTDIINLEGYFGLSKSKERSKISPMAVRMVTFWPGSGYVGFEAAKDKDFIKQMFLMALEGWVNHLKTGELAFHQDYVTGKREEELGEEVERLTGNLK